MTCQTEVSEQYHVYLQTRQQSKDMCIAAIEQYTHTTIQFPTMLNNSSLLQDNLNTYGRRTSVTIIGSPTQVCQARKLFDVRALCLGRAMGNDRCLSSSYVYPSFWHSKYRPTKNRLVVTTNFRCDSLVADAFSLAQTAHIKDKLNVTTTIRTRKDKIGKVTPLFLRWWHRIQRWSLFVSISLFNLKSTTVINCSKPVHWSLDLLKQQTIMFYPFVPMGSSIWVSSPDLCSIDVGRMEWTI